MVVCQASLSDVVDDGYIAPANSVVDGSLAHPSKEGPCYPQSGGTG